MKRSIKAAALAVAMALSGGAYAATGDVIVDIHNTTAGATLTDFFVDISAAVATSGASLTFDLTNNAGTSTNWSSFYVPADAANYEFIVAGLTQTGLTRSGDIGFVPTAPASPSASNVSSVAGTNYKELMDNLSLTPTVGLSATTGAPATSFATIVGVASDYGIAQGTVIGTATSALTLYYFTGTGPTKTSIGTIALNLGATDQTITLGTASAVPEPGTYALMAAGLLAVGAIVRRRARG